MAATSIAVAAYSHYRNRKRSATSPTSISPGESLAALMEAATHPPQILYRLQILHEDHVVLYIFRVPGRRDLCLSFHRPGADTITQLDVMHAVYYCRHDGGDVYTLLRRDAKMNKNFKEVALIMDPPGHIDVYEEEYEKIEPKYWALNEQDRFSSNSHFGCYMQLRNNGLEYATPWKGSCEMVPSKMGSALRSHHVLQSYEGDPVLKRVQIAELRFNFQTTVSKKPAHVMRHTREAAKISSAAAAQQVQHFVEAHRHRKGSTLSQNSFEENKRSSMEHVRIGGPSDMHKLEAPEAVAAYFNHPEPQLNSPVSPAITRMRNLSLGSASPGTPSKGKLIIPESPSRFVTEPELPDDTYLFALHSHPPPSFSVVGPRPMPNRSNRTSLLISTSEAGSRPMSQMEDLTESPESPGHTTPKAQTSNPHASALRLNTNQIRRKPVGSNTNAPPESRPPPPPLEKPDEIPRSATHPPLNRDLNRPPRSAINEIPMTSTRRPRPSTTRRPYSMFIPDAQADRVIVDEHRKSMREMQMQMQQDNREDVIAMLKRESEQKQKTATRPPNKRSQSSSSTSTKRLSTFNKTQTVPIIETAVASPTGPAYRMPFLTKTSTNNTTSGASESDVSHSPSDSPSIHPIPDLCTDDGSSSSPSSPPPLNAIHPDPDLPDHARLDHAQEHHVTNPALLKPPPPLSETVPLADVGSEHEQDQAPQLELRTVTDANTGNKSLDLTLGREKLGGGFDGEQAKLGKLIIEAEGMRMLDLVVATNILAFTRAGAAAGVW